MMHRLICLFICFGVLCSFTQAQEAKKEKEWLKATLREADKALLTPEEQNRAMVGVQKARRACIRLDLPRTAPGGVGSSIIVKVKDTYIVITNAHCVLKRDGKGIDTLRGVSLPGDELPWKEIFYDLKLLKLFKKEDLAFYEILKPRANIPTVSLYEGEVAAKLKVATVGWPWGRGSQDGYPVMDVGVIAKIVDVILVDKIAISLKGGGKNVTFGAGSSGGALVTLDGSLVGINRLARSNGGNMYVGAIPLDIVKKCLNESLPKEQTPQAPKTNDLPKSIKSFLWSAQGEEKQSAKNAIETLIKDNPFLTASQYQEIETVFLHGKKYAEIPGGKDKEDLITAQEGGVTSGFFYDLPDNYTPKKKWPLMVFMHGGHFEKMGSYAQWRGHLKQILQWFREADVTKEYIVAVPATPEGYAMKSWRKVLYTTIQKLSDKYRIDRNRIYLGGGSMGAFGAWETGLFHGDRFAGILSCSGGYYNEDWLVNCHDLSVFLAHGAKDPVCQPENSRQNFKKLKELHYETTYMEFPKNGHAIPYQTVFKKSAEWFKKRPRITYPKQLIWRAPDPAYFQTLKDAHSWYWLEIPQRGKDAFLTAKIDGNTITVTTKDIQELKIYLNDHMVNMDEPVTIVVNGKEIAKRKINRNAEFMIAHFNEYEERGMIFANAIPVVVP